MTPRDYQHHLVNLREALHERRASAMVGAGFSFNAIKRFSGARSFPSWATVATNLAARMYSNGGNNSPREAAVARAGTTSGTLRLAEEFQAAFNRSVLLNFVRDIVPDGEHDPSVHHENLLQLPWANVFTTNYDTLLERAALRIREPRYEVVRCLTDLPLKRTPRILKLHGTLPELRDLILTEEDYRQYPVNYGPFVAEVQAAIVQTHLCLFGFSGDDPNFLAWTGWVRDRLGKTTLPIYLCILDDLPEFQEKMLKDRSIIPLPLATITGQSEWAPATARFLELLAEDTNPPRPRWCMSRSFRGRLQHEPTAPQVDIHAKSIDAIDWSGIAIEWRRARLGYPGWIIPHREALSNLWSSTEEWIKLAFTMADEISDISSECRVLFLYELTWRASMALFPLIDRMAEHVIPSALSQYDCDRTMLGAAVTIRCGGQEHVISRQELDSAALFLHLECLRHSRETGNSDRFQECKANAQQWLAYCDGEARADGEDSLRYQEALKALVEWDHGQLSQILARWSSLSSPVWALRRAGLLIESGRAQQGEDVLHEVLQNIRYMGDNGTPLLWSVEAWARYILDFCDKAKRAPFHDDSDEIAADRSEGLPSGGQAAENPIRVSAWLRDRDCDPPEIIRWLGDGIEREVRPLWTERVYHDFDRRHWQTKLTTSSESSYQRTVSAYRICRLSEDVGIPIRRKNVYFMPFYAKAVEHLALMDTRESLGATLRLFDADAVKQWFTRDRIAQLSVEDIEWIERQASREFRRLSGDAAIHKIGSEASYRFVAAVELLSRLTPRLSDDRLCELICCCGDLIPKASGASVHSIIRALKTLVRRACDSFSWNGFLRHLSDLFLFPVPSGAVPGEGSAADGWDDPIVLIIDGPAHRKVVPAEAARYDFSCQIQRLQDISIEGSFTKEREVLIQRLFALSRSGFFNECNVKCVSQSLWTSVDPVHGLPAGTGCDDSLVSYAECPHGVDVVRLLALKFVECSWPTAFQALASHLEIISRLRPDARTYGARFDIEWSERHLMMMADKCVVALSMSLQESEVTHVRRASNPGLRAFAPSKAQLAARVRASVGLVLDNVILQREQLSSALWGRVLEMVRLTENRDLPLLVAYPKLCSFSSRFKDTLQYGLMARLSSTDWDVFLDGVSVLSRWSLLQRDVRIPSVPRTVLSVVQGQLQGMYSRRTRILLEVSAVIIDTLPPSRRIEWWGQILSAVYGWCRELRYPREAVDSASEVARDEQPDLRRALTLLCLNARKHGIADPTISDWLTHVAQDGMSDIRQLFASFDSTQVAGEIAIEEALG